MHQMTLAEIARGLADKKFSSEELTRTLLARIAQLDPQLNSFISVTEQQAIEQAQAAEHGLHQHHRSLADAVLGRGEAALTELSDAELHDLVRLRQPDGPDGPDGP